MMIVGHRWEYQFDYRGFKCVPLPFGGVESYQWCIGCGCRIGKLELCLSKLPIDNELSLNISLDMLADNKRCRPIQAGTFAELKFRLGYKEEEVGV